MHRRVLKRLAAVAGEKKRSFLSPLIIGLGIWVGFPTVIAYQDMTSLVSGLEQPNARWNAYVEKSVAGSVHAAEMPFVDSVSTGSISGSGVKLPGIGSVSFRGKGNVAGTAPDEDRITRGDKKGRIVHISPVAPPKNFNAGSIFERTSSLLRPSMDSGLKLAFAKPGGIRGKEIQIAQAFHIREDEKPDPGVPAMLAALVNNDKPDVLATAYAQAEPDYAKASPFEALLQDEQPNNGRFIPPMSKGDHSWIQNPLPASVFSKKEQACLANGIYFEARGESDARPGRRRPGHPQSRPQPGLSEFDLRRRLPERPLVQSLPVLLRLRRPQEAHRKSCRLQDRPGCRAWPSPPARSSFRKSAPRPITTPTMSIRVGRAR